MKLSTHTRYAIRILFELHLARGPISIAALSELTNIGLKTVENIHAVLRQNDITASIIGAHGGIRLNKPLSAISLGKMIELFDEGVRFVVCFGEKSNDCPRQNVCETRSVWKTISGQIPERARHCITGSHSRPVPGGEHGSKTRAYTLPESQERHHTGKRLLNCLTHTSTVRHHDIR